MIVARHEVPGTKRRRKRAVPVGYGMICAGLRTGFEDWGKEISNVVSFSSQRDSMIVARHEVPGTAPTAKEPSRRVRYDLCRSAHRFGRLGEG